MRFLPLLGFAVFVAGANALAQETTIALDSKTTRAPATLSEEEGDEKAWSFSASSASRAAAIAARSASSGSGVISRFTRKEANAAGVTIR